MKKSVLFMLFSFLSVVVLAQISATVDLKTDNFKQIDETTIEWELWMKKNSGDDFGLYAFSMDWIIDQSVENTGSFETEYFTVEPGTDNPYPDHFGVSQQEDATYTKATGRLRFAPFHFPTSGAELMEITSEWKHVATFTAQLRKDNNPHNFANELHNFAFRLNGVFEVFGSETPYVNDSEELISVNSLTPVAGTPVNDRQLAGHFFTSDGDWDNTDRWNNVTVENANTLPGANANAIINGNAIINSDVSLLPNGESGGELTILTGEAPLYKLTIFSYPGGEVRVLDASDASPIVPYSESHELFFEDGFTMHFQWIPDFLESFVRWEEDGVEIGTNSNYLNYEMPANDVIIEAVHSGTPRESFIAKEIKRNEELNSSLTIAPSGSLTVDKLYNDHEDGAAALVIDSDATGTGSLILNNEGVLATVNHFIPASTGWPMKSPEEADWYWISPPIGGQNIVDFLGALDGTGSDYDLYRWGEEKDLWYNHKDQTSGNFAHTAFQRGYGYLFAAQADATYTYTGALHVGDETWADLGRDGLGSDPNETFPYDPGWHLIGNPYPSGLQYKDGQWVPDNVSATPQYYDDDDGSYKAYEDGDIIPPMTAFFVQAEEDGGSLEIPETVRAHAHHQPPPPKSHNENYIILTAEPKEGNTRQFTYLRYAPEAIDGYDYRYDSRFRPGTAPLFFSMKDSERLLVQAISDTSQDVCIPLFFKRNNEGYEFLITAKHIMKDTELHLLDRKANKTHTLSPGIPYEFVAFDEDDARRFDLCFAPTDPTGTDELEEEKQPVAWYHHQTLYVNSETDGLVIDLYDISGRHLRTFQPGAGHSRYPLHLPTGVYMLRIMNQNKTEASRIIVQ